MTQPTRHIGVGTFTPTPLMYRLVQEVLDSGRISYGPMSLAFERRFAELHGAEYAILSNSGTSSLQVALQALKELHGWSRGDQVIVPATTFVATANIVLHNQMRPVFVDVDPCTYNIDVAQIERVITNQTRAIIPVSLFGQTANLSAVRAIADRQGLKVLHDSCETMFCQHAGKPADQWADITAYSFYNAHLVTAGVGGMSLTDNPDYAGKMRSLVNHGLTLEALSPGENFSPQPVTGRRFTFDSIGHSFRITELEAALGLAQLGDEDVRYLLRQRRANAQRLTHALNRINTYYGETFQAPTIAPGSESAWMMFPIVLKRGSKDQLIAHLNAYGIETRDMLPLVNQPAFKYLTASDYPVSANLIENGLYIGCHQGLTPDDLEYVNDVLGKWVDPLYQAIHILDDRRAAA